MTQLDNISKVKLILQHNYPSSKIISINKFSEGFNNDVFDVKISQFDDNIIIKIIMRNYSEKGIFIESKIYDLLNKRIKNIITPRILVFDSSKKVIDKTYIIFRKINGVSLSSALPKMSKNNKKEVFEQLGENRSLMHKIKFEKYGEFNKDLKLVKTYSSYYRKKLFEINKQLDKLKLREYVNKTFVNEQIIFWENNKRELLKETKPCLCHGDSANNNVIVEKIKNSSKFEFKGFIDFEFVKSGGGVDDIFKSIRSFESKFEMRNYIKKGYEKHNKLPSDWEKLALLYNWIDNLQLLNGINKVKWNHLSKVQTNKRRKEIIKRNTKRMIELNNK